MEITEFVSKLNQTEFDKYKNLYEANIGSRKYFIEENRDKATYMDWFFSKGTNYSCYIQYLYSISEEQEIDNTIEKIRTVIYALHKPLQFTFFYWTILLYVLYKFNFKNKIIRIISLHLILRSLGDVVDKFGSLWPRYFSNQYVVINGKKTDATFCFIDPINSEHYPFRWFFTRQIGCTLWLAGEIVADWYSLIRTREIVKNKKTIWYVYVTCGLFNLSKITLIIHHWMQNLPKIYDKNGVYSDDSFGKFYNIYWTLQLIIIYASVFYDLSVYYVLKKYDFQISNSSVSFVKKFKTFSTYRIRVTAICSIVFLPLISVTIFLRLYYYYYKNLTHLEFSFDEIKVSIANLQYFIIFIDQILLSYSQTNNSENSQSSLDFDSQNSQNISNNKGSGYNNNIPSYTYLSNLKKQNEKLNRISSNATLNSSSQSQLMSYNDNNSNANLSFSNSGGSDINSPNVRGNDISNHSSSDIHKSNNDINNLSFRSNNSDMNNRSFKTNKDVNLRNFRSNNDINNISFRSVNDINNLSFRSNNEINNLSIRSNNEINNISFRSLNAHYENIAESQLNNYYKKYNFKKQ